MVIESDVEKSKKTKDNHYRPIVYGNTATPLKKPESENTHCWLVYVRGLHNEDISYYVDKVVFRLHESFAKPIRIVEKWPFELQESGWGEFEIKIKVHLVDPNEKVCMFSHFLRLYPIDDPYAIRIPKQASSNTVTNEYYDEIVFYNPSAFMEGILNKEDKRRISLAPPIKGSPYEIAEAGERKKLEEAKKKLEKEIVVYKKKIENLKKTYSQEKPNRIGH